MSALLSSSQYIISKNSKNRQGSRCQQQAPREKMLSKPTYEQNQFHRMIKDFQPALLEVLSKLKINKSTNTVLQPLFADGVFDCNSTNSDMFQYIGQPLVTHSLEGYNVCVLAYGQTSSGKTYTMKGNQKDQGIIPLTLKHLFKTISAQNLTAQIKISYLEIYNQNIIDLLSSVQTYLDIREDQRKNITILGLNQIRVSNVEEAMKLFEEGESRRKFASNNLNVSSSRSHAIFRINAEIVHQNYSKTSSCINMVDLAGSQGVSRTKAEGNTKKEGENINKSILALSNVIRGMSQKWQYVNFRDSKLTRILQSSLLNNSRSIVICTINPISQNYQQTINTLKFGMYASQIRLEARKNANNTNQRYQQSQAKSIGNGDALQPQQRVQYQENKRIISQLRQQNQQLRDYKRLLNQKIEFLELQNHRLLKNIERLEEARKQESQFNPNPKGYSHDQKEQFNKKIEQLKQQMVIMADRYDAVNEYSTKLQKNQRYLLDRIAKYESQISILKDTATIKQQANKVKTPVKPKAIKKPARTQQFTPLTIKSIIILKTQIIQLKQHICQLNEDIAGLVQERNQILAQLQQYRDKQTREKTENGENKISDAQKKQVKNLHMRIKSLKNEVQAGKNRQKKLTKMLKSLSEVWIEQYNQFNQWYHEKKKRIDSLKKARSNQNSMRKGDNIQNQSNQI